MKSLTLTDFLSSPQTDTFIESAQPFFKLMMQYQCAMLEIQTKFQVLNTEMSLDRDHKSIESITCRLKQPKSIIDKLKRRNIEINLKNIETELHDVAGIRVICSFPDDIYKLAEKICSQDDVTLIEKKDYISSPKPNGYRSLHLILEIPVFFANETKRIKVEVQLRVLNIKFVIKKKILFLNIFWMIYVNVQTAFMKWICICKKYPIILNNIIWIKKYRTRVLYFFFFKILEDVQVIFLDPLKLK